MFGVNSESPICMKMTESTHEKLDQLISPDAFVTEMFSIGKRLSKIDQDELDYILVKKDEIKSPNDKLMLLTYLNSKMDIVNYYIEILNNPALTKKYTVPYTMNQIMSLKNLLNNYRSSIIAYKIPERTKGMTVIWDY